MDEGEVRALRDELLSLAAGYYSFDKVYEYGVRDGLRKAARLLDRWVPSDGS